MQQALGNWFWILQSAIMSQESSRPLQVMSTLQYYLIVVSITVILYFGPWIHQNMPSHLLMQRLKLTFGKN